MRSIGGHTYTVTPTTSVYHNELDFRFCYKVKAKLNSKSAFFLKEEEQKMQEFQVKDKCLAPQGRLQIEWASAHMPVLNQIKNRFTKEKPLKGFTLGACLHVTKETAVLVETLMAGGAKIALCGSNPLSTQDDVAAALAEEGVHVFAWRGQTTEEYYKCIDKVLDYKPMITLDDGADLVGTLHSKRPEALKNVKGGTEETTTGVVRLRAMENAGSLKYAIIAVNDAYTKYLFDNRYGTGQSTIDGILEQQACSWQAKTSSSAGTAGAQEA